MIACTYVQLCGHFVRLLVWQVIKGFDKSKIHDVLSIYLNITSG
jgi:hypothetical protein